MSSLRSYLPTLALAVFALAPSPTAAQTCDGLACNGTTVICGTSGNNTLSGNAVTPTAERICGFGGDDTIFGHGGDDRLFGGDGADRIHPGAGDDVVDGGNGINDFIDFSNAGAFVWVFLQLGLSSGSTEGVDTITTIEHVQGSNFGDGIVGNSGVNQLNGGDGDDTLNGLEAGDTMNGGPGNDTLWGGDGADTIFAGQGDDEVEGELGNDTLDGGAGTEDWVTYQSASGAVGVNCFSPGANGAAGTDTLANFENVEGSAYDDCVAIANGRVRGGNGDDIVSAPGGYADFEDQPAMTIDLNAGTATSANGDDSLLSVDSVIGSQFGDSITGNANVNWLFGRGGDDFLYGMAQNDFLRGEDGNDFANGGGGTDNCIAETQVSCP